jgi:hypothetical protein
METEKLKYDEVIGFVKDVIKEEWTRMYQGTGITILRF